MSYFFWYDFFKHEFVSVISKQPSLMQLFEEIYEILKWKSNSSDDASKGKESNTGHNGKRDLCYYSDVSRSIRVSELHRTPHFYVIYNKIMSVIIRPLKGQVMNHDVERNQVKLETNRSWKSENLRERECQVLKWSRKIHEWWRICNQETNLVEE